MSICNCAVLENCPTHAQASIDAAYRLVERQTLEIGRLQKEGAAMRDAARALKRAMERQEAREHGRQGWGGDSESEAAYKRSLANDVADAAETLWKLIDATKSTKCQAEEVTHG